MPGIRRWGAGATSPPPDHCGAAQTAFRVVVARITSTPVAGLEHIGGVTGPECNDGAAGPERGGTVTWGPISSRSSRRMGSGQLTEQSAPFRVKAVGLGFAVDREAVKPRVTESDAGIVAVYDAAATLTSEPLCVAVPPHRLVMR